MNLIEFFSEYRKVALAYSGDVESAYLLFAGIARDIDIMPYYVKTCFQSESEMECAPRFADVLGKQPVVLEPDVFARNEGASNPTDCNIHRKKYVIKTIMDQAIKDGYDVLIDGTNADDETDFAHLKTLQELGVISPLRMCGIDSADVHHKAHEVGISI